MDWKKMRWIKEEYGYNSDDGYSSNEDYDRLQKKRKEKMREIRLLRRITSLCGKSFVGTGGTFVPS
jgi:hypothetical protein